MAKEREEDGGRVLTAHSHMAKEREEEGGLRQSMGRGGSHYRSRRLPQHSPPTWRLPSRLLEASPPWYPWYPENISSNPISIQRCHSILWLVAHQLDKPAKIARECGNRPFRSHHQYQLCI